MNKIYIGSLLLLLFVTAHSQQLPDRSYFSEMGFVWNPAITGESQHWEAFAAYRQQWAGFEGNPNTVSIGTQFPILDFNMGLGGFIIQDYVQPISSTNIGLNYAYHLELGFLGDDVLSIGLLGTFSQFGVEPGNIFVSHGGDDLVPVGERSKFTFNAGFGFYYVSHSNAYSSSFSDRSYFFMGLAANQVIPFRHSFEEQPGGIDRYQRSIHANGIIGARILNDYFFVEPFLWVNYAEPQIFNMNFGVKAEWIDIFWGGLTYSTNEAVTLQAGYILTAGLPRFNSIRIGSLATFNTGSFTQSRGLSYEFYLAYRYLL